MALTPKNRKEEWLQGLVDHETTLTPKNRPEEWMKEIIDASGGGGGTGGGDVMIVTLTPDEDADDDTYTSSATATEIATANSEGKVVIGKTGVAPFFVSVVDIMGMLSIDGIQLSKSGGTVIYHLFSMDTTTNKWTDTPL